MKMEFRKHLKVKQLYPDSYLDGLSAMDPPKCFNVGVDSYQVAVNEKEYLSKNTAIQTDCESNLKSYVDKLLRRYPIGIEESRFIQSFYLEYKSIFPGMKENGKPNYEVWSEIRRCLRRSAVKLNGITKCEWNGNTNTKKMIREPSKLFVLKTDTDEERLSIESAGRGILHAFMTVVNSPRGRGALEINQAFSSMLKYTGLRFHYKDWGYEKLVEFIQDLLFKFHVSNAFILAYVPSPSEFHYFLVQITDENRDYYLKNLIMDPKLYREYGAGQERKIFNVDAFFKDATPFLYISPAFSVQYKENRISSTQFMVREDFNIPHDFVTHAEYITWYVDNAIESGLSYELFVVSEVRGPQQFTIVPMKLGNNFNAFNCMVSDLWTTIYKRVHHFRPLIKEYSPDGLCVMAFYESNWHRAMILDVDIQNSNLYNLYLVDKGATVSLHVQHLSYMHRLFLKHHPAAAVSCQLNISQHCRPQVRLYIQGETALSPLVELDFKELMIGKLLQLKFIGRQRVMNKEEEGNCRIQRPWGAKKIWKVDVVKMGVHHNDMKPLETPLAENIWKSILTRQPGSALASLRRYFHQLRLTRE